MKIRSRLFVGFILAVALVIYLLVDWVIRDLRPQYLETMEESMVDSATILAAWVSMDATTGIRVDALQRAMEDAQKRRIEARIYAFTKTQLDMRVYVTDSDGTVVFDSNQGLEVGRDYSSWNDVRKTLGGQYGARTTRQDPGNPLTSMLYVAAPVMSNGKIVGVLTVGKPARSVRIFLQKARWKIAGAATVAGIMVVVLGLAFSVWVSWPIEKLTAYARAIRDGKKPAPIRVGRGEVGELAEAFDEMRHALEGRQHIEEYVRTLTVEMKGPLSLINGAADLLAGDLSPEERRRFAADVRGEAGRIQDIVDRMMQLSSLENRHGLRNAERLDICLLLSDVVEAHQRAAASRGLTIQIRCQPGLFVRGERYLIRQALGNLVQNALEFSPPGGKITVFADPAQGGVSLGVADNGAGIPEGALEHMFERFYSLPRPDTGKKSVGLGLSFVQEAIRLHGGDIRIRNRPEGGAIAAITLPHGESSGVEET